MIFSVENVLSFLCDHPHCSRVLKRKLSTEVHSQKNPEKRNMYIIWIFDERMLYLTYTVKRVDLITKFTL